MLALERDGFCRVREGSYSRVLTGGTRRAFVVLHCPLVDSLCLDFPCLETSWELKAGWWLWASWRPSWCSSPCFGTAECLSLQDHKTDVHVFAYLWEKSSLIKIRPGTVAHACNPSTLGG